MISSALWKCCRVIVTSSASYPCTVTAARPHPYLRTSYGPYYFLYSIMDIDTVQPDDALVDRVDRDKNGDKYADDLQCVTKSCIINTVDL